ncbi:MAG: hypothetical protein ABSG35_13760 [Syntrophobacteraceae bacterium]|jgi:hypothetical protein
MLDKDLGIEGFKDLGIEGFRDLGIEGLSMWAKRSAAHQIFAEQIKGFRNEWKVRGEGEEKKQKKIIPFGSIASRGDVSLARCVVLS